jgi:hypothetical protein
VSVGGLLDRKCGNNIHENPKYGRGARKKKKEDKVGVECAVEAHPGLVSCIFEAHSGVQCTVRGIK